MSLTFYEEWVTFLIGLILGAIGGVIFDISRIIRHRVNKRKFISVTDMLFWAVYLFVFLIFLYRYNDGMLRGYIFIAVFISASLYFMLISSAFLKVGSFILKVIEKIITFIVLLIFWPIKFIYKKMNKGFIIIIAPLRNFKKKLSLIRKQKKMNGKVKKKCKKKI